MSETKTVLVTGANKDIGSRAREGAATAIRLATLPDHGPTGGFFEAAGVVPW